MMKTVPPLNDLFNMAGLNLPDYLKGKSPEEIAAHQEKVQVVEKKVIKEKPAPENPDLPQGNA